MQKIPFNYFIEKVREFHVAFGLTNNTSPIEPLFDLRDLRYKLFQEEFEEYLEAYVAEQKGLKTFVSKKGEEVNTFDYKVDAITDMMYILAGDMVVFGYDSNAPLADIKDRQEEINVLSLINTYNFNIYNEKELDNSNMYLLFYNISKLLYINNIPHNTFKELFDEVHKSNMSKLDKNGKPVINGENGVLDKSKPLGKVVKSDLFVEPDLKSILEKYGLYKH